MKPLIVMQIQRRASLIAQVIAAFTLVSIGTLSFAAADPDQSQVHGPAGDGWQALSSSGAPLTVAAAMHPTAATAAPSVIATTSPASLKVASVATMPVSPSSATMSAQTPPSYGVVPVVVGAPVQGSAPAGNLTLAITPQDINLRNALDRWLQQQGWQLAWKIDDDLPLEFNATFNGDFDSLLTQVMRSTNHMRTPTRVCEHTNNVLRVVARAANCQD